MKNVCFGFMFVMLSLSAFAQEITCLDRLLPFSRFSGHHTIAKEEWYDGKDALDIESAASAVTFLANSKLLCRPNEVVIKIEPVCGPMIADLPQSNTCFVFTNLGHFLIIRDNGRNTNIIFTKDKKFSGQQD
jgi:hypothetical protein